MRGKRKDKDEERYLFEKVRKAFARVKSELEDHLDTINQNTSDVHELNEMLSEIDTKLEKLAERIDDLEMAVNPKKEKALDIKLTPREQEVFITLYLSKGLSVKEISKRLGFTQDRVNMYLLNMIGKGVHIRREIVDDLLVFSLEPEFKDLQARKNVLNIDPKILKQFSINDSDI